MDSHFKTRQGFAALLHAESPAAQLEALRQARHAMAEDRLAASRALTDAHVRVVLSSPPDARDYALGTILFIGRTGHAPLALAACLEIAQKTGNADTCAAAVGHALFIMKESPKYVRPETVAGFQRLDGSTGLAQDFLRSAGRESPVDARLAEMRVVHARILEGWVPLDLKRGRRGL